VSAHAPAAAELCYVGKRGGRPSARQADINALLVARCRAGRRVVRLKGGCPSVFGRAGGELAALAAAGVPTELVPGVSRRAAGGRQPSHVSMLGACCRAAPAERQLIHAGILLLPARC